MISEIFASLFTSKEKTQPVTGLAADRYNAKEIDTCPKCKSKDIKKTVWKLQSQRFMPRTPVRIAAERYALGCEIEWRCPCGFIHNGPLFKE